MKKILFLFLVLILVSCASVPQQTSFAVEIEKEIENVKPLVNYFFYNLEEGNFEKIFGLYSKAFYDATDRESWEEFYYIAMDYLGSFQHATLVTYNIDYFYEGKTIYMFMI